MSVEGQLSKDRSLDVHVLAKAPYKIHDPKYYQLKVILKTMGIATIHQISSILQSFGQFTVRILQSLPFSQSELES